MTEQPTTAAGRALLLDPDEGYPIGIEDAMGPDATRWRDNLKEHIVAIEAEASRDTWKRVKYHETGVWGTDQEADEVLAYLGARP